MHFKLAAMLKSLRVVFFCTHVDTTTSTDHTSAICYETLDYFSPFCQIREEGGASVVVDYREKWALGISSIYH